MCRVPKPRAAKGNHELIQPHQRTVNMMIPSSCLLLVANNKRAICKWLYGHSGKTANTSSSASVSDNNLHKVEKERKTGVPYLYESRAKSPITKRCQAKASPTQTCLEIHTNKTHTELLIDETDYRAEPLPLMDILEPLGLSFAASSFKCKD